MIVTIQRIRVDRSMYSCTELLSHKSYVCILVRYTYNVAYTSKYQIRTYNRVRSPRLAHVRSGGGSDPPDHPTLRIACLLLQLIAMDHGPFQRFLVWRTLFFCRERSERATPYTVAPPGVPAAPQAEVREAGSGGCDQAARGGLGAALSPQSKLRSSPWQAPAAIIPCLGEVQPPIRADDVG